MARRLRGFLEGYVSAIMRAAAFLARQGADGDQTANRQNILCFVVSRLRRDAVSKRERGKLLDGLGKPRLVTNDSNFVPKNGAHPLCNHGWIRARTGCGASLD